MTTKRKAYVRPVFNNPGFLPSSYALSYTNGEVMVDEQIIGHFDEYGDAGAWGREIGLDVQYGNAIITG